MPDKSYRDLSDAELNQLIEDTRLAGNAGVFAQASEPQEPSPLKTALEQKIIAQNDPGLLETINMGFGNQLNMGWGPQVRAAAKSGGGLLSDYPEALKEDITKYEGAKAAHPIAAPLSEVAGALASVFVSPELQGLRLPAIARGIGTMLPRIGRATEAAATIPERLSRAAVTGGVYGGVEGAGTANAQSNNLLDTIRGGGVGAATGAVLGPAISGLVSGLGAGRRYLGSQVRNITDPQGEAVRRVTTALQRDQVPVQTAQQQLGTAIDTGTPMIVADTGDAATQRLARAAANKSPEAQTALKAATDTRFENQTERTTAFLRNVTGAHGDTTATAEALRAQARRANRPAYQAAYAEGEGGVWNEQLQGLTAAPAVQDAMRGAVKTGANRAAADGFRPPRNPFVQGNDGTLVLPGDGTRPTLQFWDHVKQNLDDAIDVARRKGENSHARDLQDLRTVLVDQLDAAAPSYRAARQGAARFFGAEDALDVGTQLASGKTMHINDVARGLAGMTDAERRLAREGYVNQVLHDLSMQTRDRSNVTGKSIFSVPGMRERSRLLLGNDQADQLETFIRVENVMNRTREAVSGNSTTLRQFLDAGAKVGSEATLAGGMGLLAGGGDYTDPKAIATALLTFGARKAGAHFDRGVMERVGRLLASNDPRQLDEGLRLVARNQGLRTALAYAEQALQRPIVTQGARAAEESQAR